MKVVVRNIDKKPHEILAERLLIKWKKKYGASVNKSIKQPLRRSV